jgi:hypothetical protein
MFKKVATGEMIGWTEEDVEEAKRNRQAIKTFHKKWFTDQKKRPVVIIKSKRKRKVKKPPPKLKKKKQQKNSFSHEERKKVKGSQT